MSGRPHQPLRHRGPAALALTLALALLTGACAGNSGSSGADPSPASASERAAAAEKQLAKNTVVPLEGKAPVPELPVTVDSSDGREVTVEDASRILPLNGGVAEIVFTLGLGDRVVGRDITATFEEAKKLPQVTKAHDVSAESVLSLHPTVVLADTDTGPKEAIDQIRDAGCPRRRTRPGHRTGRRRDADHAHRRGPRRSGGRQGPQLPYRPGALGGPGGRPRGQPAQGGLPVHARQCGRLPHGGQGVGRGLADRGGGRGGRGCRRGPGQAVHPLTGEALVKAQPDVILMMTKGLESVGGVDGLLDVPGIKETPAGLDRRIVTLEDGVLLSYGPRTPLVIDILVDRLHRT